MQTTTEGFRRAVTRSHKRATRVDVLSGGEVFLQDVTVTGGSVTMDSSRSIRSSCNLSFHAEGLVPKSASDPLYPAANEIAVYSGIDTGGNQELLPCGVYGFEEVDVDEDSSGLELTIAGSDRAAAASRTLLLEPIKVAKGTPPLDAITQLLNATALTGLVDNGTPTLDPLWLMPLAVYQPGDDPWALAVNVATAFGLQLYVNREGNPVLDVIPDPDNTTPAVTYDVDDGAAISRLARTVTSANTYNGVVASGEGSDLVRPLQATAWDADPTSPFYYLGRYGKKPLFWSSPLILEIAQAEAAARAKLKQVMGGIDLASWSMVCNPALDVYDVAAVKRDRAGVNDNFVVESITMGLTAEEEMSVAGRTSIVATEVDIT